MSKRAKLPLRHKPEEYRTAAYQLLEELGVVPQEVQILIVGDGSGTANRTPCGWASVLYDFRIDKLKTFSGSASNGSNNVAELMAILHPLEMFIANSQRGVMGVKILVVSDSQYVICGGERVENHTPKANPILWGYILQLQRQGVQIQWRHTKRNSHLLALLTDHRSRERRLQQEAEEDQIG